MEILIIILLSTLAVLLYFIIGIGILELTYKLGIIPEDDDDDILAIMFAIFWPICLAIIIIVIPIIYLNIIVKNIKKKKYKW